MICFRAKTDQEVKKMDMWVPLKNKIIIKKDKTMKKKIVSDDRRRLRERAVREFKFFFLFFSSLFDIRKSDC